VLDRISPTQYIVCYLTTFARAGSGDAIAFPSGRYFGIAIGEATDWPPGFESLKTYPRWEEHAYVYGAPFVTSDVRSFGKRSKTAFRTFLRNGELQRVKDEVANKMRVSCSVDSCICRGC
jgi:hypothetical protein